MPVISRFYGIIIRMYFAQNEHNPPHIHAIYGEYVAAVSIQNGNIIEGYLPGKSIELVREWIGINQQELLEIWDTQKFKKIAPLE